MNMLILDQPHMDYSQPQQTSAYNAPAIYLQDFRSEPCQVCGENASGWHCGSITCEACKKFFLRSVNEEYRKYKCIRDKKCIITRTTRTQCQYCRYMKCIEVGMKLSEGAPNPKIEEIFKLVPCAVCQRPSSGIHFGATTCEGCKGFFRRTIKERTPQRYKCPENYNCEVNSSTRSACRACRFQKCLAAGMSIEGSRIGRQSNLFKHKMVELQRRGLIRSQIRNIIATNTNNYHLNSSNRTNNHSARKKNTGNAIHNTPDLTSYVEPTVGLCLEDKLESYMFQQIVQIEDAYMNCLKDLPFCSNETNDLWFSCESQLNEYTARVGDFALRIPEFCSLTADDKTLLIHSSTHSVIVACLCFQASRFRSLTNDSQWNYLNILTNCSFGQSLQQNFPFFFDLNQITYSFEREIQLLELDDREIALMIVLLIASIANSKLNETEKIEKIQEDFFCALYDYMSAKRGIDSKDYFILTIQIPLIHRINSIISTNIVNFKCSLSCNATAT
ncbi:unnamed protein product [Rotaria socialis]|uniref:Uncharacterized protein n=1 Tax=Rotaria socialis TaxID=392032 RepID=A0A819VGJ8_9BILA|nr:unnamed protein product [Rotaria socialis]CAF4108568.1 unnamed protein product [Rotaria socialis]